MSGKAGGSGNGNGDTPTYFNDCVSKNELRAVLDGKLNAIQQIINLSRRIEDVEQHLEPHPKDVDDDDLKGEDAEDDDGDTEAEAEVKAKAGRAEDAS